MFVRGFILSIGIGIGGGIRVGGGIREPLCEKYSGIDQLCYRVFSPLDYSRSIVGTNIRTVARRRRRRRVVGIGEEEGRSWQERSTREGACAEYKIEVER